MENLTKSNANVAPTTNVNVNDLSLVEFLTQIGVKGNCEEIADSLEAGITLRYVLKSKSISSCILGLSIFDPIGLFQFQPTLEQLEEAGIRNPLDRYIWNFIIASIYFLYYLP